MNQYSGVPAINPETVIQVLAEAYPKTLSMTTLQGKLHSGRPRIESALFTLIAQGRVKTASFNTVATVYRLSEDEAVQHGFKRENPVKSRTHDVYKLEPLKFKPMQPVRPDAEDAMQIMSRRGDSLVPFAPPIHMGSNIAGGMQ